MNHWFVTLISIVACLSLESFVLGVARLVGLYAVVNEREARVYVLFGKVLAVLNEPGLYCLWIQCGWKGFFVNMFGQCYVREMSLAQEYLRSTAVNSEEGAPMGIGIWYEMFITDPVAHVFKNVDPRGSLRANVGNATVKCLSNMPLAGMLETRHQMSQIVREEVSAQSKEWGYQLGSVYVRKVHFRDGNMIRQIEEKVVNRLRQVTAAIRQNGANQVNLIASAAEKEAAGAFANAAAMRPKIVGGALQEIAKDQDVKESLFEVLETQRIIDGEAEVTLLPANAEFLAHLLGSQEPRPQQKP